MTVATLQFGVTRDDAVKMTSPMMNALRSSESMNAGTTVKNGVAEGVAGFG